MKKPPAVIAMSAVRCQRLLDAAGITQAQLARLLALDVTTVNAYCRDRAPIPPAVAYAVMYLCDHGRRPGRVRASPLTQAKEQLL